MTFWTTVVAVLWALAIYRLIDYAVDVTQGYFQRRKVERILDELEEFWHDEQAAKKPARKKAVAKRK